MSQIVCEIHGERGFRSAIRIIFAPLAKHGEDNITAPAVSRTSLVSVEMICRFPEAIIGGIGSQKNRMKNGYPNRRDALQPHETVEPVGKGQIPSRQLRRRRDVNACAIVGLVLWVTSVFTDQPVNVTTWIQGKFVPFPNDCIVGVVIVRSTTSLTAGLDKYRGQQLEEYDSKETNELRVTLSSYDRFLTSACVKCSGGLELVHTWLEGPVDKFMSTCGVNSTQLGMNTSSEDRYAVKEQLMKDSRGRSNAPRQPQLSDSHKLEDSSLLQTVPWRAGHRTATGSLSPS
ncbi:hypothetical protein T265_02998 [Opisthorchis viverrini]|uniref:Uncharacterized protein n=1 Tax=Opisthorchis viverrini TaxID=6198 RepID=A0A075AHX6_OPIVI|nr:hypothetical protein T265_02998 [Opisthorchis viverrini]KER30649.1 hypothetical protein T265_02998 [Opisthorchis viverrini]